MQKTTIIGVRGAFTLVILFLVGGCASTATQHTNQPAVPIGSQLQLNLSADLPIDQNRIFIQQQMIVSQAQLDREQLYCSVVLKGYQENGARQMKVEPGSFTVNRVRLYNDYVYQPVIYANTDDNFYLPSFGIDYVTELHLSSSEQPDVVALHCTEHRARYERNADYPDRSQFDSTLGDLVTLP